MTKLKIDLVWFFARKSFNQNVILVYFIFSTLHHKRWRNIWLQSFESDEVLKKITSLNIQNRESQFKVYLVLCRFYYSTDSRGTEKNWDCLKFRFHFWVVRQKKVFCRFKFSLIKKPETFLLSFRLNEYLIRCCSSFSTPTSIQTGGWPSRTEELRKKSHCICFKRRD